AHEIVHPLIRRPQPIADPRLGQDKLRAFGIGFDLLSELADKDAQILRVRQFVPELLQQEAMGQHLAGMLTPLRATLAARQSGGGAWRNCYDRMGLGTARQGRRSRGSNLASSGRQGKIVSLQKGGHSMPRKEILDQIEKYTHPFRITNGKSFRLKD